MTVHASAYELTSSRTTAGTGQRIDVALQQATSVAGDAVNSDVPLPQPSPVPLSAYGLLFAPQQYVRALVVTDDPTDLVYLEGDAGLTTVQYNGTATLNGVPLFQVQHDAAGFIEEGRLTPGVQLTFGSAVQTALNALTGNIQQYVLNIIHRNSNQIGWVGHAQFVEFEDAPPSTGSLSSQAQNFLNKMSDGGAPALLGIDSAAQSIYAQNCSFTGIAPEGAVYVRPEDLGNSNEQIPAAVGSNTAAHFRFHPSVFVRRSDYYNGVMRRVRDSVALAQTSQGQPLKIVSVTQDPVASNWLFQIDGQISLVSVTHPAGSDLRRPRDIWNTVIVPAIDGSAAARQALTVGIPGSSQGSVGVLSRLKYLEYARCLPLAGTKIVQDDTNPPA
jgi:hypothetical protein